VLCGHWDTRNKNKFEDLYAKANFVLTGLKELKKLFNIKEVYIEQSLHSFRSGFSSAQTLSTLSRFNGIVSWFCFQSFKIRPKMIAAVSARKRIGIKISKGENAKQKSLEFILDQVPSFVIEYTKSGNVRPGYMDRSDSCVIAKAGYLEWSQKS